jgi:hypothetical protein
VARAKGLAAEMQASVIRRRDAVERWKQDPFSAPELVIVCCRTCRRPIATTKVDQEKGEPAILLELRDEHEPERWSCTECGKCPKCGYWIGVVAGCVCPEDAAA